MMTLAINDVNIDHVSVISIVENLVAKSVTDLDDKEGYTLELRLNLNIEGDSISNVLSVLYPFMTEDSISSIKIGSSYSSNTYTKIYKAEFFQAGEVSQLDVPANFILLFYAQPEEN